MIKKGEIEGLISEVVVRELNKAPEPRRSKLQKMASVKEILKNPMHKEIERIKTKLSKEMLSLSWPEYKETAARDMRNFLGPDWKKRVVTLK